jgi:hypothetical protein
MSCLGRELINALADRLPDFALPPIAFSSMPGISAETVICLSVSATSSFGLDRDEGEDDRRLTTSDTKTRPSSSRWKRRLCWGECLGGRWGRPATKPPSLARTFAPVRFGELATAEALAERLAGESLHAPVCAGVEEARPGYHRHPETNFSTPTRLTVARRSVGTFLSKRSKTSGKKPINGTKCRETHRSRFMHKTGPNTTSSM